jgi:hypothetical protein
MPIEKKQLEALARTYVGALTSIRGRRAYRLLMREFVRFERVLPAVAEDGTPVLLALGEGGSGAVCRTDGRGPTLAMIEWARLSEATVTFSYDFTRDSLPLIGWRLRHPSFAEVGGALSVSSTAVPRNDHAAITEALRRLAG